MDVVARIRVGELSPALGRAVYRIVQEALTNAAKHAPGGAVTVDVVAGGEAVAVSVVNKLSGGLRERWPQPGACGQGQGHGLASIRDRATLLGGAATVGATGDGEFAVRAVMPLAAMLPDGASTRCTFTPGCDCLGCAIRHSVPMSQRVCGQGPAARPEGA
jgi:signal transduction histidine kinase